MAAVQETVDRVRSVDVEAYKYGFVSPIESDVAPKGLNEDIVRFISAKKEEPEWLLLWRLDAFRRWLTMDEPKWARVEYPPIDFQEIHYFSAPKTTPGTEDRSTTLIQSSCALTRSSAFLSSNKRFSRGGEAESCGRRRI